MDKFFRLLVVFVSMIFILGSCASPVGPLGTTTTTTTPTVGKVVLTPATGLSGRSVAGNMLATEALSARSVARALGSGSTFSLGDIPSTSSFYFIVQNTGGTPVTNLTFSIGAGPKASDGVTYLEQVTPGVIGTLDPVGTAGVLQIVKVTVIHGQTANLLANAEPSPQGPQSLTVHMAYTDSTGTAQTSDVVMSYNVQSWALVFTVTDTVTGKSVTIGPRDYYQLYTYSNDPFVAQARGVHPSYSLWQHTALAADGNKNSLSIMLTNTGNVPVTLSGHWFVGGGALISSNMQDLYYPVTLTMTPGQVLNNSELELWFQNLLKGTPVAAPGQTAPGILNTISGLTLFSDFFTFTNGEEFDIDSSGVVSSVQGVFNSDTRHLYSLSVVQ